MEMAYHPMLAREGPLPAVGSPFVFEIKWDGYRCGLCIDASGLTLISRQGTNLTTWFLELRKIGKQVLARRVLIDGEIIASIGYVASFNVLQRRARMQGKTPIGDTPITFVAFDLFWLEDKDIRVSPWPLADNACSRWSRKKSIW
jgi:bifunctional non-homologous end joining protein LigD